MSDETNQPQNPIVEPQTAAAQPTARTVFMVTSGCYSDYGVDAIFEQREDAERFVEMELGEDVSEIEIYSGMPEVYTVYTARISKHGGFHGQAGHLTVTNHRAVNPHEHTPSEWDHAIQAIGPDRERVIKSVRDRYAAWKAGEEQVT